MSHSLKLCLVALLNKPGVTVGRRGVRLIATLLAMAVALGWHKFVAVQLVHGVTPLIPLAGGQSCACKAG